MNGTVENLTSWTCCLPVPFLGGHEFPQGVLSPGVAQTMWSGFDLHPRNLLDDAPLYQRCVQVPSGMVGWWPLDESSASQLRDINPTGTANHGTSQPAGIGSGGPFPIAAATGGGLLFNGSNFVEINDDPTLHFGAGDFSIDTWIKAKPTGGVTQPMIDKRVPPGSAWQGFQLFLFNANPGLQLGNGIGQVNYTSTAVVADGHWHHLTVTVNRTSSTKELRWYVDGALVQTMPAPLTGSINNAAKLTFGKGYPGQMGETELFNRVLTAAEVRDIYTYGKCE